MRLVVDSSVAVKWFLPEVHSAEAAALLNGDIELGAPDLLLVEAANIFWKKVRLGELDHADADVAMVALSTGGLHLLSTVSLLPRARVIARDLDHPIYDCAYLAAAEAWDTAVVSADRRLFDRVRASPLARRVEFVAPPPLGRGSVQ